MGMMVHEVVGVLPELWAQIQVSSKNPFVTMAFKRPAAEVPGKQPMRKRPAAQLPPPLPLSDVQPVEYAAIPKDNPTVPVIDFLAFVLRPAVQRPSVAELQRWTSSHGVSQRRRHDSEGGGFVGSCRRSSARGDQAHASQGRDFSSNESGW